MEYAVEFLMDEYGWSEEEAIEYCMSGANPEDDIVVD